MKKSIFAAIAALTVTFTACTDTRKILLSDNTAATVEIPMEINARLNYNDTIFVQASQDTYQLTTNENQNAQRAVIIEVY